MKRKKVLVPGHPNRKAQRQTQRCDKCGGELKADYNYIDGQLRANPTWRWCERCNSQQRATTVS